MPTSVIDFYSDHERDVVLAQNLGTQLAQDDCSDAEIYETIESAFPDENLQVLALHSLMVERYHQRDRHERRIQKLQSWRDR